MSQAPILYGGLTFDPLGIMEPQVLGQYARVLSGGETKYLGEVVVFDSAAEGWEVEEVLSSDYPAPRAGHTMTSIGPSALTCGGYSPVVSFEVVINLECSKMCGKTCDGSQPTFVDEASYLGVVNAVLGTSLSQNAKPGSDFISDVYVDDARPKLSPTGEAVDPAQTVLTLSARPKAGVLQSQVRAQVENSLKGSSGTFAQFSESWKPESVVSRQATQYDNSNGVSQFRALNTEDGVTMDCWWFSLRPIPRWDKLQTDGSEAPNARSSHAAVWDYDSQNVIMFGGLSANGLELLNDCWFLTVENAEFLGRNVEESSAFAWEKCAVNASEPIALPCYGHSAIYHGGVIFVFGGYQRVSLTDFSTSSQLTNDVWALEHYLLPERRWRLITPLSDKPPARAFNALWMTGGRDGLCS